MTDYGISLDESIKELSDRDLLTLSGAVARENMRRMSSAESYYDESPNKGPPASCFPMPKNNEKQK